MAMNKRAIAAAALAGIAFASPAPQQLDFNAIVAAPEVAQGPVVGDADQTVSLYTSFAITGATTAASAAAATVTPAPVRARDIDDLEKRWFFSFPWFWPFGQPTTSTTTPTPTPTPNPPTYKTTSSSVVNPPGYKTTSTKVTATSSLPKSTSSVVTAPAGTPSSYTPYYPALATSYTTDPALTGTTTAGQACPTTPEDGTYCGFINPLDPCAPQFDGYGPVPTPDTASAFLAFPTLHAMASAAPSVVPSTNNTQYTQVFKDLNAAVSGSSYLGLVTLQTYSVAQCAASCDANSLCTSFNLFAERDPSLNPSANDSTAPTVWGYWCPNPPSMTSFKCTLWGSNIDSSLATNAGQGREQFEIVITASNGYDKTNVTIPSPPTCSSSPSTPSPTSTPGKPSTYPSPPKYPNKPWSSGQNCGGKAINSPNNWLGSRVFPGPFNPQVCGDFALAQTSANLQLGSKQVALMFNAYFLHKNGRPWGTGCALYNTQLGISWATYAGASFGGDTYSCKQSWTFSLTAEARGVIGF